MESPPISALRRPWTATRPTGSDRGWKQPLPRSHCTACVLAGFMPATPLPSCAVSNSRPCEQQQPALALDLCCVPESRFTAMRRALLALARLWLCLTVFRRSYVRCCRGRPASHHFEPLRPENRPGITPPFEPPDPPG